MINENNYFLIDTDAATKIERALLGLPFFSDRCKTTEENLYEMRDNDNLDLLSQMTWKTNSDILSFLPAVWAVITKDDKILNLYQNEGNGDIMILATLLYERELSKNRLFSDEWVIVTDDKGLTEIANRLSFNSVGSKGFIDLLKAKAANSSQLVLEKSGIE